MNRRCVYLKPYSKNYVTRLDCSIISQFSRLNAYIKLGKGQYPLIILLHFGLHQLMRKIFSHQILYDFHPLVSKLHENNKPKKHKNTLHT